MAQFGACYPCFCADGEEAGVVIGKLVAANLTVTLASGELWADDGLAEQLSEFANGSVAMETDDMVDDVASKIYGATVTEGEVIYSKDDTPPRGAFGYYQTLMRNGQKFYRGYFLPRVRAALGNDNAQTRGNNITFTTTQTTLTVMADDNGVWRRTKTFDTKAAAIAWVQGKCKVSAAEGATGATGATG